MKRSPQYGLMLLASFLLSSCGVFKNKTPDNRLTFNQKTQFDNLFFEASKLKVLGDYTSSAKLFKEALEIDPSNHAVMYQMSNLNMAVQNYSDAIYWAEKSIEANPEYNFWYYGQLAQAYSKAAEFKKSAETFLVMAKTEPKKESNYIEAGNQFINARDWKSALEVFEDHQKRFGLNEESSRKMERIYFALNKPKEAIRIMQDLVNAFPTEVKYRGLLAESFLRANKVDEALNMYQSILEIEPDNGYAFFGLADIYRQKGDIEKSFDYLIGAFRDIDVDMGLKLKVLASFYQFVKTDESIRKKSMELSNVLVETHPNDGDSYMARADIMYAAGDLDKAREDLLKSVEIDPSDLNVWQKLLSIDDEIDNLSYIESDSRKALEFFPNQVFLYIINSFANFSLENYVQAIEQAELGLEISVINSDRIDLLSILADANHVLENHSKSDAAYDELLEIDPNNDLALNNYAYYLSKRNIQLEKALTMVKKALSIAPGQASYIDTHGWVLYQLGRFDEAVVILKKAYSLMPNEPEVMEHYAKALIKTGQEDEGNDILKRAQEIRLKQNTTP